MLRHNDALFDWKSILKFSVPQFQRLRENHPEEIKDTIREKVAEIAPNMTLGLFVNY